MSYQVVYDVTHTRPDLTMTVFGSMFIVAGSIMVHSVRRATTPTTRSAAMAWFPYVFLGFGVFWTCAVTLATVGGWYSNDRAMREGRVAVVEGIVEDFVAMPAGGHAAETFAVDGHPFRYGDGGASGSFAYPMVRGGPLRSAQRVRIHERGGAILRLEIEAEDLAGPIPDPDGHESGVPRLFAWAPLVLLVWFPFVTFVMSFVSGWRSLARRFAGTALEGADGYLMQSGRVGKLGSYRSSLNVAIAGDAFSLKPMLPFGFFHPLVVIPWSAVASVESRKQFLTHVKVATLTEDRREIQLSGASGEALERAFERWREKRGS